MLHPEHPHRQAHPDAPALPAVAPSTPASRNAAAHPPRVLSEALLGGGRELEILHRDALYRLRVTAMGKLILTK